ncbi:MAG: class I SAM-dependent methyltransferase [Chloroflexi bacterium]|nr:class I SAM-dependent methyltransferase [Chloroflexota bacterium]
MAQGDVLLPISSRIIPNPAGHVPTLTLLSSPDWEDYELIDSGSGLKLERYGKVTLVRPGAEAIWQPALPQKAWDAAQVVFEPSPEENGGHWVTRKPYESRWKMEYKGLTFWSQTTASRHLGVFPEQASQWDWAAELIRSAHRPIRVLNLFGYTGLATLSAARAGARVTHVDASKKVIGWARENQALSGLEDRPIRWIVDDALKFVRREIRRGSQYEGLILDPPKFGRGPKGEVWEFYKLLPDLLHDCQKLLSPQPLFIMLTGYAVKASGLTLYYALDEITRRIGGAITAGELVLAERSAGRLLSTAVFACWQAG